MKSAIRCALGAFSLLATGCQLTPSLVAVPRIGPLSIKGDIFVSSSGASVRSDAEELGLEDDDAVFEPRLDFAWGPAHIMGTAYTAEYEGTGTAQGQLDLGGVIISAGEQVDSQLDVTSVNVVSTFDVIPTDFIDLGLGLGVRVLDFEGRIQSLSTGEQIASDEMFAMPVAAGRAAIGIGPLEVSLIGSGLGGSYSGIDAHVLDLDLMGEYAFEQFLGFHGSLIVGYRYIDVGVEYTDQSSDVEANLEFAGPYVGIAIGN